LDGTSLRTGCTEQVLSLEVEVDGIEGRKIIVEG
jgi:hypothetical protein